MKNKYLKNLAGAIALTTLAACSGSGSCPPNGSSNTGELTLKLTAPDQYPAGMPTPTNAYLTMTNTSNVNATNLYYAIPDASNHTGVTITVANDSNPCKSIPAHQACSFPVVIAANANPGSFTVTATTEASSQNSVKKLWNTLKSEIGLQSNTLSLTANIGLTNVPANSASGANGITFLYAQTIAGNAQNATQIEIVGVVNSATAGAFNTINLTDKDGNLLNFEVLSGNSGTGLTNLARGSIVTFMLTIPVGSSTYQFYAQTLENETPKSQGTVVNPIILTNSDSGVLVVQPGSFNLLAAESYTSQTITYTNIGNGDISGLSITQPDAPLLLSNNNCGSTLSAGKSCTVVLTSNATPGISGSGSLTAQYTNGSGNNTIISQYNYAGLNPQSGISLSAVNNFTFSADTVDSSQSTQVTIENTGNVNESNFVFSFSPNQYFTITTGTGATPCSVTNNTITSTLAAGNSCSITLTYNNPNIASSSSTMMINYNYNGQAATQVSKTMSYSTTQATASIGFNPASPYTFNSIIANGIESDTQIFTITNNGPDAVNGLFNTAITGDFNIMPSTGANDCQTKSNLASGQNCTLTLRFGPTATAANPAVGTFTLSGTSATGGTINSVMTLNGNARTPLSANVQIYSIGHSASVVYGDGESAGSAFQIELTNAAGLAGFTLYYKNTGAFAATNFTVDTSSLPSGYTVDSDSTCGDGNTMTLESNGANYCYVILKPNTNSPGNLNITLTSMPATWTDERGPQTPQTISWDNGTNTQNTIYVNVFASPQVTAVMSSSSSGTPTITNPTENTDFYVVYTLTGGYSGQSFTYGVTLGGTSGSPAMSVYSPTTCTITSPATSCSIKIASGGAATNQSITYAPQGGAVTPTPASSGNFNVVAAVPTWKVVGNADFSAGSATLVTLALTANSIPYVAYADGANGSKVTVMKLDGSIWKYIGESGFSDGQATGSNISLGVDSSGTPYVAYVDASFNSGYGGVAVKKFNGTAWVNVGQNNMVSAGVAAYPSLAISSSDVPYLAYKNDQMGQIYAKAVKFNNNSGSWDDIGTDGKVTAANADWISLALNSSDQPFIACLDGNGQAGVLVRTYDGNSWQDVGSKITSSNDSYINIALNSSGNPRVGYLNNTNAYPTAAYNDNSGPASQWSFYGQSSGFDNNTATSYISLALDTSGNPYLAFQDDPNGSLGRRKTASVITWSNSTWSYVGESQITSGEAKYTSLKLNSSNVPYLAFSDEANGGKVMVMFYK